MDGFFAFMMKLCDDVMIWYQIMLSVHMMIWWLKGDLEEEVILLVFNSKSMTRTFVV